MSHDCKHECDVGAPVVPFAALHATPVIPKIYWDVYSAEERWKHICCTLDKLIDYANQMGVEINANSDDIAALESSFEKFMESGFFDYYAAQLEQWIEDNAQFIIETAIRQVYFGLTLDGHFVAYIPESWSDIVFDTGADYALDTYGRLILRWDVDGDYNVDQTPEVVRPWGDISEIEWYVRNIMNTLYSSEGGNNG